jgi:hypothetical protein
MLTQIDHESAANSQDMGSATTSPARTDRSSTSMAQAEAPVEKVRGSMHADQDVAREIVNEHVATTGVADGDADNVMTNQAAPGEHVCGDIDINEGHFRDEAAQVEEEEAAVTDVDGDSEADVSEGAVEDDKEAGVTDSDSFPELGLGEGITTAPWLEDAHIFEHDSDIDGPRPKGDDHQDETPAAAPNSTNAADGSRDEISKHTAEHQMCEEEEAGRPT